MSEASALLRFSRDRRGYEHFYLIEPASSRHARSPRILYWFRTPPGVKVGRPPFDAEMQRAIEAQNPGVSFDWKRIVATPIPPPAPDVERWRERRRTERAERAARKTELAAAAAGQPPVDVGDAEDPNEESEAAEAAEPEAAAPEVPRAPVGPAVARTESSRADASRNTAEPGQQAGRKRRRRRGGRGRRPNDGQPGVSSPVSREAGPSQPAKPDEASGDEPAGD